MIKVSNPKSARAVINEIKGFGIDVGHPETDEDYVTGAYQIYKFAKDAMDEGMNGEHVVATVNMYESFAEEERQKAAEIKTDQTSEPVKIVTSANKDKEFYNSLVQEKLPENMPIPEPIEEEEPPNMPLDISELSDMELMKLHGAFSAYAARIGWLYSLEEAGESAARVIRRRKVDEYTTNKADRYDEQAKKAKTQDALKAEAYINDEEVRYWTDLLDQHEIKSRNYKHVFEIYTNNVDRLSRAWTMRQQERENAR